LIFCAKRGHKKSIEYITMVTKPTTYTKEYVLNEVKDLLHQLSSHEDFIYKGELLNNKPYSRQRLSEWAKSFREDEEISDTIQKIEDILETRVVAGAMKNKLSTNMVKFHLMNNYSWKDKASIEQTVENKTRFIISLDE
jgi:hypothetical protein